MMQMSPQTPITLIGGYLGAGKTTFINKLLNSGRLPSRTAVLVNDFGDINIDEHLIRSGSKSDQVIGLANGCVCCSIADDLTAALEALKSSVIERVLLECSGVAEPQKARLQCHYPGYYPHASVVLVDALNHAQRCTDKYVGTLVSAQVKQADLIVMSKSTANPDFQLNILLPSVDADAEDAVEIVLGWQGTNDSAETGFGDRVPKFFTETWRCQESLSAEKLIQRLDALPASVHRVKGFVATNAGIVEIQRVGTDMQITPWQSLSRPDHLGLVFISHTAENLALLGWAD